MWKYYTDPRSSNTLRIYQSSCLRHVQRGTKTDCRDNSSGAPDWLRRHSDIDEADELSAIKKGKDPFGFSHPWCLLLSYEAQDRQDASHLPPPLRGVRLNIIWNRLEKRTPAVEEKHGLVVQTTLPLDAMGHLRCCLNLRVSLLKSLHLPHHLFFLPPSCSLLPPKQHPQKRDPPPGDSGSASVGNLKLERVQTEAGLCLSLQGWKEDQRQPRERGRREFREQS